MRNSFLGKIDKSFSRLQPEEFRGERQSPQLRAGLSKKGEFIPPGVMIQRCADVAQKRDRPETASTEKGTRRTPGKINRQQALETSDHAKTQLLRWPHHHQARLREHLQDARGCELWVNAEEEHGTESRVLSKTLL